MGNTTKSSQSSVALPEYQPPKTGILSLLPASWVPYAELIRLAKPVGIMNIYFPYLFGMLFAACITHPTLESFLFTNSIVFFSAFILRSVGCTWNDIIDRDLDRHVARCRLRPMARGAISPANGYIFAVVQCVMWLGVLSTLISNPQSLASYSIPLIMMVMAYPFCKRLIDYAQVVLGFTLSWGVLIGCLIMGIEPASLIQDKLSTYGGGLICVALAYVVWSVFHDTIYALQDLQDDLKAGIKSMAVRFRYHMKLLLAGLAVLQVALLVAAGHFIEAQSLLWFLACPVGNAVFFVVVILFADLNDTKNAAWWFEKGSLMIGAAISLGLFGEYVSRL